MYRYGRNSMNAIKTLHPSFVPPLMDVIKIVDISISCGARGEIEQDEKFSSGVSTVKFPDSAHNPLAEDDKVFAFDGMPYTRGIPGGIDWRTQKELFKAIDRGNFTEAYEILENIRRIRHTAGIIIGVFHVHGIPLINGADWDGDNQFNDHKFTDSPHYQHKNWKKLREAL